MIHVISGNQLINEVTQQNNLIIVAFCLNDSIPSKTQYCILQELEQEFSEEVSFYKIDLMESQEIQLRYQISSAPVLLFFKNGIQIERIDGVINKDPLKKYIIDFK